MRLHNIIALSLMASLVSFTSYGRTVSDVDVSEEITFEDTVPLKLNGAALRETYVVVDTYVGGLYLETPSNNGKEILDAEEHKRMLFHVLLRKVTARKIARALKDALVLNITKDKQEELEPQIDQFLSMFDGKLHKGDEVNIDYIPEIGTRVQIAGKNKGIIPGKAFSDAMLSVWIGENPVSENFKNQVLGIQ